jgi:lysyl-tRNA synthetase class II
MNNTFQLFNQRKEEIEFYFSILLEILKDNSPIKTIDNQRFGRILKSNFLLMLYNLIESCVKKGFEEIYELVKNEGISYQQVSNELKNIWTKYEISKAHKNTANLNTYVSKVKKIIEDVLSSNPIVLKKDDIDISGNLDVRKIKELLSEHNITFSESKSGDKINILLVKNKRNALAHGDESFDEAAREKTIEDLEEIKDEVLLFIGDVLNGMKQYSDNKLYEIS